MLDLSEMSAVVALAAMARSESGAYTWVFKVTTTRGELCVYETINDAFWSRFFRFENAAVTVFKAVGGPNAGTTVWGLIRFDVEWDKSGPRGFLSAFTNALALSLGSSAGLASLDGRGAFPDIHCFPYPAAALDTSALPLWGEGDPMVTDLKDRVLAEPGVVGVVEKQAVVVAAETAL
jgi:hypothetical protein